MANTSPVTGRILVNAHEKRVRRISNGGVGSVYLGDSEVNEKGKELKEGDSIVVDETVHVFANGQTLVIEDSSSHPVVADEDFDGKPKNVPTPKVDKKPAAQRADEQAAKDQKKAAK